jgi:TolB-like protein/class 3 adenylate cyclase
MPHCVRSVPVSFARASIGGSALPVNRISVAPGSRVRSGSCPNRANCPEYAARIANGPALPMPAPTPVPPPTGTLTFLFSDIEGSTRMWQAAPDAMQAALARHDAILRRDIEARGGHVFKTAGDAFCAAFATPWLALEAALAAQQALRTEPWPPQAPIRVRIALHSGAAELRNGDYFGPPLNHVARLLSAGHGGQTLVSSVTCELCHDRLPAGAAMKSLGEHGLKDLARRQTIYQLSHPALPQAFPPLRTLLAPLDAGVPSIAVLPFVNMSTDEENEFFADGLSEELLNVLAKIKDMRVASRTSAWSFKGTRTDTPTIAQKLGVAHLLEGSVRKAGNRVRITAQLIDVATDSHLWSETYDRELTDIFAVQDDIAQSVVIELRRALLDAKAAGPSADDAASEVAHAAQGRGDDAVAYQLYLEGRSRANFLTKGDNARAIELFGQAVALQPDFALAWAGLSRAHNQSVAAGFAMPAEGYARARAAAQRALALAPDLVEGLVALGQVLASDDLDWKGADATFRKAIELAPGNAAGLHSASWLAAVYGRIDEALALARRIVALDPLAVNGHVRLARLLADAGAYDEAETEIAIARKLEPAGPRHHAALGRIRLYQGRYAEALAEFEQEPVEWERKSGIALARARLGPPEAAAAALQDIITHDADVAAIQIAEVYAYVDERDAAFAWLERAYVQKDHGVSLLRSHTTFRGLHRDPRWQPFLAKIGIAD